MRLGERCLRVEKQKAGLMAGSDLGYAVQISAGR
jgi:hypothetical protein